MTRITSTERLKNKTVKHGIRENTAQINIKSGLAILYEQIMMHNKKSSSHRNTTKTTLRIWRYAERTEEKLWEGRREMIRPSHLTILETSINNENKLKTILACKERRVVSPLK
jgi:hypothetical protein